jgi:pimeloyl-ACP methyl ester carboxylesterase
MAVELSLARPRARVVTPHVVERTATVNAHEKIAGSTLITVEQFGHFIWWGDAEVTRDFEAQIEQFLDRHLRRG